MRKQMPTYWIRMAAIYVAVLLGVRDMARGHATPLAYWLIVVFASAALLVQLWLKPSWEAAWDRLRELDSSTS